MRFHYGQPGVVRARCGKRPHALHGLFLILDWSQVTCKRCLQKKAATTAKQAGQAASRPLIDGGVAS